MKTKNSRSIKRHSFVYHPHWGIERSLLILISVILLIILGIAIPAI